MILPSVALHRDCLKTKFCLIVVNTFVINFGPLHFVIFCCFYRSSCPEVFLGKGVLNIRSKFTGEHPSRTVISIKLLCSKFTGEHPSGSAISIKLLYKFIEITLRLGCSPVNLLYILRTPLGGCFCFY